MRIASITMARNYTSNLNSGLSRLNAYSARVYTQRRFMSMAEDTASGVRAMKVRRALAQNESITETAKMLNGKLSSAETSLLQVSSLSNSAISEFTAGMSGDKTQEDRNIYAENLRKIQESVLSLSNAQYAGQFVFGGTNTTSQPFTVDASGDLLYNGVSVKNMTPDDVARLKNDAAYVDLGLGLTLDNTDPANPNEVKGNSAFKSTLSGIEVFGYGDNNLYNKLGEMIDALENGADKDTMGNLLDTFKDVAAEVNLSLTQLGADTQYLENTLKRLDFESISLKERQNTLEIIDPAQAIMEFKMQEYIYNAALQMGQRILQPTLFSFLN